MNNPAENSRKNVNGLGIPKPQKRKSHWTLLFVGDHGRVISLGQFKRIVIVSTLVVTVVVAITGWLYFLYRSNAKEKNLLKNALEASRQKITVLQDEKDQLMVRLVLAESKINADQVGDKVEIDQSKPDVTPGRSDLAVANPKSADLKNNRTTTKLPAAKPVAVADTPNKTLQKSVEGEGAEALQIVNVEKLTVLHETDTNRLKIQFALRKTDLNTESVIGRAFVILKPQSTDPNQWLTIPSVSLKDGRPSKVHRGQYFSIARFKPMKFEHKIKDPSRFQNVAVFIFSKDGKLLLEKEFAISIQSVLSQPKEKSEN